ncbi:RluA family pseudouridine synthase [Inquilinus sp. CAU 1745]|uniref:RluA family pseudouridine synthase n=1 Tax=Inquilinus sp. CAU 1745 TaxID=3140369 RepID=UPI00325B3A60
MPFRSADDASPADRRDVTAESEGRLDKILAAALPDLSRARLQGLIASGHVAGDGGTIDDASRRVKPGQRFIIVVPPAVAAEPEPQAMDLAVVYEDEAILVLDKPAGLVVHPAAGNPDRTLVNALLAHCGDSLSGIGGVARPGIVHRLDKDTSGLMVVAKNDSAHAGLSAQFADRTLSRSYLAVTRGVPSPRRGVIEGAIGRSGRDRKKMAVVSRNGKEATTFYEVREALGLSAALVACELATGRTHQIRVHLTSIGHPIVGDPTYGGGVRGDGPDKAVMRSFPRQALHAAHLKLVHPLTGEKMNFDSPMPADMTTLTSALRGAD